MKQLLSPGLVKNSLSGHSWLGILVGVLMYIVCLSGTLAVFYQELERWEQPTINESLDVSPAVIQQAYNTLAAQVLAEENAAPEAGHDDEHHRHMFVNLPTQEMPRAMVSSEAGGWFVNADGSLGEKVQHDWTHLLINLHLFLHLPMSFGMLVVSILGALLCGLIISGFLSHPRIFKDAFTLRLKGAPRLGQADLHNRLSVWGAPFHLMIAVTGAFFGFYAIFGFVSAHTFFDGDQEQVIPAIYGAEPDLQQEIQTAAVGRALAQMHTIAPDTTPIYITVEPFGEAGQYMMVGATHPNRLIYAEQYRFDSAGNYLDKAGFSDGEAGRQAIFSVYRIHFGHFGGFAVKVLYGILGLALTVISVSGINIWLAKRKQRDALNNFWTGIVWGTPAALVLSAITQVFFSVPSTAVLWFGILAAMVMAQLINQHARSKSLLQYLTAVLLVALVAGHALVFGSSAWDGAALGINLAFMAGALIFIIMPWRRKTPPP